MKSVLLRLEGPLQSWGTQSRFGHRDTDAEPSKSGVLGLIGAALGMPRDDRATLGQLTELEMALRVDREGRLVRDYHTAGAPQPRRAAKPHLKNTVVTERFYLAEASFVVALGGPNHDLIHRIDDALADPRWPLFLGRKSCPPGVPVGSIRPRVVDEPPIRALRGVPWSAPPADRPSRIRLVVETSPDEGAPRADLPLSFALYDRRFAERWVAVDWLSTTDLEIQEAYDYVSLEATTQPPVS